MAVSEKQMCDELLWGLLCYEICCGRLSPEMRCLLDDHMKQCPSCRKRIEGFFQMLYRTEVARNSGKGLSSVH